MAGPAAWRRISYAGKQKKRTPGIFGYAGSALDWSGLELGGRRGDFFRLIGFDRNLEVRGDLAVQLDGHVELAE